VMPYYTSELENGSVSENVTEDDVASINTE
jgi:hypothetical protein